MKILSWNCHGLGNPRAVRALKKLIRRQDPTLVFLMETRRKAHETNNWRHLGGLANILVIDCNGEGKERSGGIALMWKNSLTVELISSSQNHIDVGVTDVLNERKW